MAFKIPPYHKRIVTVIRGRDGQPLLTFNTTKSRIVRPDGSVEETQTTESQALIDGRLTHPGRMVGPEAQLPLLCEFCQKPPWSFNLFERRHATHGLVEQGDNCGRCGRCACLKHGQTNRDGLWLCTPCTRKVWLGNLLFGWLWEEVD
jgi:hypothetical protein